MPDVPIISSSEEHIVIETGALLFQARLPRAETGYAGGCLTENPAQEVNQL